jgi:polyphosphate kinase 2 (PPK2 family)
MFESASLKHKVDKATFRARGAEAARGAAQRAVRPQAEGSFPVLILIAGVEGAGKGETVNLLNEWMDPRHIETHAFFEPSSEEAERPAQWRFWKALPPKGKIGIFFGAWHSMPIIQRVFGGLEEGEFAPQLSEITRLEKMLCDEGVLLLKYWFHLSRGPDAKALRELEKDPRTRWRVTEREWEYYKRYRKFVKVCEPFLRRTSSAEAPWIIIRAPIRNTACSRWAGICSRRCASASTRNRSSGCPTARPRSRPRSTS